MAAWEVMATGLVVKSCLAWNSPSCTALSQLQGLGVEESAGSGVSDVSAMVQQLMDSLESATGFCASQAHNGLAKTNIIIAAITLCHQTVIDKG